MFTSEALAQMIRFYGNAMQGVMGKTLESGIRAMVELQDSMRDQAKKIYGDNITSPTEMWAKLMSGQGPGVQNLMSSFIEQSRTLTEQMQERMQQQARTMFGHLYPGKDDDGKPR